MAGPPVGVPAGGRQFRRPGGEDGGPLAKLSEAFDSEMPGGLEFGGAFGLLLLIANVYAVVSTIQSSAGTGEKVLWIVVILVFPLIGFLLWLLFGPAR